MEQRWEFWIDVGGTFTDCIARSPDGSTQRLKTLSSGVVKGKADRQAHDEVFDATLAHDPPGFWVGWKLRCLDADGHVLDEQLVVESGASDGTQLKLAAPLKTVANHFTYELDAGLDGPTVAMRRLTQTALAEDLPPLSMRLGTTRGTNALLTRQGAKTAWVTTKGFGDLLEIGYQSRPDLFDLEIKKPQPLYCSVLEITERIDAQGNILIELDSQQAARGLKELLDSGIEAVAIGFLHGHAFPAHERQVAKLARELGFLDVSVSHEVAPLIKLVARGDTTVANAYLNPTLTRYIEQIRGSVAGDATNLRLMTSSGGLVAPNAFEGKDSVLSGPAGGVVGAARVASAVGRTHVLGFDMGGTSTDVSRFDGQFDYEFETEKAGVRIVTPMLSIETVAAGGGSICYFDGVKLCVGPQSAGADPGPACYGRGGPLTVTDVNLFLGRLPIDALPFPLDKAAVEERLAAIQAELKTQSTEYSITELAEGFLSVANNSMAQAIRSISIAKGYDAREYSLLAFGGAAPQHACAVARRLQIPEVIDPPDGALLSAVGIGLADETGHAQRGIYRPLLEVIDELEPMFAALAKEAIARLPHQRSNESTTGSPASNSVTMRQLIELRYAGTDWPISLRVQPNIDLSEAYHAAHERLYGYALRERSIEVVAIRAEANLHPTWELPAAESVTPSPSRSGPIPFTNHELYLGRKPVIARRYDRNELEPGDRIAGPALIVQQTATTVVDPGWEAEVLSQGEIVLRDHAQHATEAISSQYDPVSLELFNGQFAATAEQMGITLRNTSSSVNVKERLDFSCAVFTARGELVVNAPHIPVHLGAMSQTVRCVLEDNPDLQPGDVIVTNDPFRGGSHLPDVTVVTPVFDAAGKELRFFTASRAHHAEIGGITPGSMPPFSSSLAEEGVLIQNFKLIAAGQSRMRELAGILQAGDYPSRDADANLADLAAQVAANQQGVRDLQAMIENYGWETVGAYMVHIQEAAERKTRQTLAQLPDGELKFQDQLDSGEMICATVTIDGDSATIDFGGSSGVHANNLNANQAIVRAAVLYVLRCLINEPLPLNEGVLAPIQIKVPIGLLNPPAGADASRCPAVAGGNVETSQRIVDVLLGAFGLAAASQGTMNNLLFGDTQFGYYETICGGTGATANAPGADAVHSHMTNTRLTDPEVLETRFPIEVVRFQVRRNSGGDGLHKGGDGIVREIRFRAPLELSILSQRRGPVPPYGLAGGKPGQLGENQLMLRDGTIEKLAARVQRAVASGDRLVIKTPGGGGYGAPESR